VYSRQVKPCRDVGNPACENRRDFLFARFLILFMHMALSWGAKRQLGYFSIVAAVALILIYRYFISPALNAGPTCFDGRQNSDERGVDCGGSCAKLCSFQANTLLVEWARVLPVTGSITNAVAYVQNQNPGSAIRKIAYEFKVYDEEGIFITARAGSSFVGPAGKFAIFEPSVNVGNRAPAKTLFRFTEAPVWEKIDKRWETFPISVKDKKLSGENSSPKLEAIAENNSIYDMPNMAFVALLYDKDGNAVAGSRTYIDELQKNSKAQIFFTWPEPLKDEVSDIDIFPDINPFSLKF